ncbi:hypothetical protein, partial [Escherichia coli]|uniref:hypothetical protein n=1 Tax=Escherichia coli TaxID=562 RepID=UPI0028A164EE
ARPAKSAPDPPDKPFLVRVCPACAWGVRGGWRASARTFTLTLTLSLKGEGTDRAQILRDIFFCLVTEEQKIGLLRLNIAEKKHGRE